MRVISCGQIFSIGRAWTRMRLHNEQIACYLGQKGHGQRMPKNNSALIGGNVWPIPKIMRLICWHQIFGIFRAWTRMSSDREQVACYLVQKEPGHRIPKNICALIIYSVTNTWNYESDPLPSDFLHILRKDDNEFAWGMISWLFGAIRAWSQNA